MESDEFVQKLTRAIQNVPGGGAEAVYGCFMPAKEAAELIDARIKDLVTRAVAGEKFEARGDVG